MSRPLPVRICYICKSPVRWRQLVYHLIDETAPPSIGNMCYFHKICYQNIDNPNFMLPPDSALDPWGALDTGWPDRMELQRPPKEEVAACETKPAMKEQVAYTQNETENQEPDSTQK